MELRNPSNRLPIKELLPIEHIFGFYQDYRFYKINASVLRSRHIKLSSEALVTTVAWRNTQLVRSIWMQSDIL